VRVGDFALEGHRLVVALGAAPVILIPEAVHRYLLGVFKSLCIVFVVS